jgi:hypothetical protein
MANLSIGSGPGPNIPATPRTDTARAAQRAFFQAALNRTAPAQAAKPTTTATHVAEAAQARAAQAAPIPSAGEPTRYARPGTFLDIKV